MNPDRQTLWLVRLVLYLWNQLMALIKFLVDLVDLIGADPITLPVTVDAPQPIDVSLAAEPTNVPFTVSNPTGEDVTLENLAGVVVQGDPALVDIAMQDTVLVVQAGGQASSAMIVTPNQEVPEGTTVQVEVTGASA